MSQLLGNDKTLSIGDKGKIQAVTYQNLAGVSVMKIKIYTETEWKTVASPNPITGGVLTATAVGGDPDGTIEADNPGTIFTVEGWYVLRSYLELSGAKPVHGDPVRFYVSKGSAA